MDSPETSTYPTQASSLKVGSLVMVRNRPCKIVEISAAKPGKHGSAKVIFVALDIFTDQKMEAHARCDHNVEVPVVKTNVYQLMSIDDEGYMSLMRNKEVREDLKLPDDFYVGNLDESTIYVTIMSACGQERVTNVRLE